MIFTERSHYVRRAQIERLNLQGVRSAVVMHDDDATPAAMHGHRSRSPGTPGL